MRKVDGILGDFGVSSHQFDVAERGFSTRFESKLDMRMNQKGNISAYEVINDYDEKKLRNALFEYGELRNSPKIAKTIVEARQIEKIESSERLKEVLKPFLREFCCQEVSLSNQFKSRLKYFCKNDI